ncbi:MAG: low temperature requirement protein A [Flavobacteriales bacterium]
MNQFKLWHKPHDANENIGESNRKVSWLELFFDIFFVCAIASVGHILVEDLTWEGLENFTISLVSICLIWIGFTFYNEKFETFGIENRIFTFLMMIPVAGLAIFTPHASHLDLLGVACSYAFARLILSVLFLRVGYYVDGFKKLGKIYSLGYFLSFLIIIITLFTLPQNVHFAIYSVILIFDFLFPILVTLIDRSTLETNKALFSKKTNERFGLLCIIVIGELIVAVVNGMQSLSHPSIMDYSKGLLGLSIGFGMWWIYFDSVARRGASLKPFKAYIWSYLHLPLVTTLVALSAGILFAIEHTEHLPLKVKWLISFSAGISILLMGLLDFFSKKEEGSLRKYSFWSFSKMISSSLLIIFGFLVSINILILLLLVLAVVFFNIFISLFMWFRYSKKQSLLHSHKIKEE